MTSHVKNSAKREIDWPAIASRLRQIRAETSQVEFGEAVGVTQNVVSRYERGRVKPPLEYLAKVATLGQVTLDWLLEGRSPRVRTTK